MEKRRGNRILNILCSMILITSAVMAILTIDTEGDTRFLSQPPYNKTMLQVNLTYMNGSPAVGASVELGSHFHSTYSYVNTTDGNGETIFMVSALNWGPAYLKAYFVSGEHYNMSDIYIEPDSEIYFDMVLTPTLELWNTVHGTVRDRYTDDPIEGVLLTCMGMDANGKYFTDFNNSLPNGEYSFQLPNSTSRWTIDTGHFTGYDTSVFGFYLERGENDHTYDIYLLPEYVPEVPFHVRPVNVSTGETMTDGSVFLDGRNDEKDFDRYSLDIWSSNSTTGLFDGLAGPGYYMLEYDSPKDLHWNLTYYTYMPVFINDTEETFELPVNVLDEYRNLSVEVWSEGAIVGYSTVSYYHSSPEVGYATHYRGLSYGGSDGISSMGIPPNETIHLEISKRGYERKTITIEPGPLDDPVGLNVTLEPIGSGEIWPLGNISIRAVDSATGLPVGRAYVTSSTYDTMWHSFSGYTDDHGYLNISVDATIYDDVRVTCSLGEGLGEDVTVTEGGNTEIEIPITRYDMPSEKVEVEIVLRERDGTPVPGVVVIQERTTYDELPTDSQLLLSDNEGKVVFMTYPGKHRIGIEQGLSNFWEYRRQWSSRSVSVIVPEGGLTIDPMYAYPSDPLRTVEGHVYDADTMEPLPYIEVSSNSYVTPVEGMTRQMLLPYPWYLDMHTYEDKKVDVFNEYVMSDSSSYYRVHGRDEMVISCWIIGYFPYMQIIDTGTRAPLEQDIMLEPLPEEEVWLNGTIVDQNGHPVESVGILASDPDHNDYHADAWTTNDTGNFHLQLYPGNFVLHYGNYTLNETTDLVLNGSGMEGLQLVLIPRSTVNGTVVNWNLTPMEGINVTLINSDLPIPQMSWMLTDEHGRFSFQVLRGNYTLQIRGMDEYADHTSDEFYLSGWNDVTMQITLVNRTTSIVSGDILGTGGIYQGGIPGVAVILEKDGSEVANATTDMSGHFMMNSITYGSNYTLSAVPPPELLGIEGSQAGYLPGSLTNITVDGYMVQTELSLEYHVPSGVKLLNITDYGPEGEGVLLDEPLRFTFSIPANRTMFEDLIQIEPSVANLTFEWNGAGTGLIVRHDLFEVNTTYVVTIPPTVKGANGAPAMFPDPLIWDFTTGEEEGAWFMESMDTPDVTDEGVSFTASGGEGLTVFLVIEGVGSYQMDEADPGTYEVNVGMDDLAWDTEYSFHLSDREDGPDLAPNLSDSFRTNEDPSADDDVTDDDEDTSDDEDDKGSDTGKYILWIGLPIILILILVIVILLVMKRRGHDDLEE